jgi:hypothetical protein
VFKFLLEFPNASGDSLADAAVHFAFDLVEAIDFNFDCRAIRILFAIHELLSAGAACGLLSFSKRPLLGAVLITVLSVRSCRQRFAPGFALLKWLAPITASVLGTGLADGQHPLAEQHMVQSRDRGSSLAVTGHLDKCKAS